MHAFQDDDQDDIHAVEAVSDQSGAAYELLPKVAHVLTETFSLPQRFELFSSHVLYIYFH